MTPQQWRRKQSQDLTPKTSAEGGATGHAVKQMLGIGTLQQGASNFGALPGAKGGRRSNGPTWTVDLWLLRPSHRSKKSHMSQEFFKLQEVVR